MLSLFHHKQFRYLGAFYLHAVTRLFAVSIFQIFTSIYIYQTLLSFKFLPNHALAAVSLLFALVYLVQALVVTPALWLITKKGLRLSVFLGSIFLIVYFILLYLARFDPIFFILGAIFSGIQIGFYWTGYHIFFVELSDDKKQGEELSITSFLSAISAIGGPAFGGLVINYGGFNAAFLVMTVMMVLAVLPLRYLPKQKNKIEVNILNILSALSPKKEIKSYLALAGMAISDIVNETFWPLLVFPILLGFVGLGFMGSLVALIAAVTTIALGLLIDKFGPKKLLNLFSALDSLVWVVKSFVASPLQVFLVSSVSGLTLSGQGMAIDSEIYERARQNDIVAFIVQREVGAAAGKFLFLLLLGILFWFGLPLVYIFLFAAVTALLTRLYPFSS